MSLSVNSNTSTLELVAGVDDDQAGIRIRVDGDAHDRIVLLPDGSVLTGNGTADPVASVVLSAAATAVAADVAALQAADGVVAAITPLDTTPTLNATFDHTEVESAIGLVAAAVNAIIAALTL